MTVFLALFVGVTSIAHLIFLSNGYSKMPTTSPSIEPSQARPTGSLFLHAITQAPISLGVGVAALMLILAVSSLGCYHASLLATGVTTSEDIKGRYKGFNPFYQVRFPHFSHLFSRVPSSHTPLKIPTILIQHLCLIFLTQILILWML